MVTVPLYLRTIGEIRYGLLLLAFSLLGYFGAFDLGLGQAVAQRIPRQTEVADRNRTFWTALFLSAAMGLVGASILYFVGSWLFASVFHFPSSLRPQMLAAVPWLAAIVPMASVISVLASALQGRQAFATLTASQSIGFIGLQVLPLVIALMGDTSMPMLLAAAFVGRLLGVTALLLGTTVRLPLRGTPKLLPRTETWSLLRFGGWVSVSGLVTPLLSLVDRFFVGGIVGAAAVAAYTVPYNVTQRFVFIPSALSTTLFPQFSKSDNESSQRMLEDGVLALIAIQTPLIVVAILLMHNFFNWWIGHDLAVTYYPVAIILLIGVWINGPSYIPHNMLPARGRPDIMARFYMIESLPFLLMLWAFVTWLGIYGAAIMWTLRSVSDATFCFIVTDSAKVFLRGIIPTVPAIALAAMASCMQISTINTILIIAVAVLLSVAASWHVSPYRLKAPVVRLLLGDKDGR